jgi:hypothetical protein
VLRAGTLLGQRRGAEEAVEQGFRVGGNCVEALAEGRRGIRYVVRRGIA